MIAVFITINTDIAPIHSPMQVLVFAVRIVNWSGRRLIFQLSLLILAEVVRIQLRTDLKSSRKTRQLDTRETYEVHVIDLGQSPR